MIMERFLKQSAAYLLALAILIPVMAGCGKKAENTEKPAETTEVSESKEETEATEVPEAEKVAETGATEKETQQETGETGASYDFVVDYKTSDMYSEDDMNKAIEVILREFNTWEGCVMKEIRYTDDQKCEDNLSYINSLAVDTKYDECIVFTSTFHSPVEGGDAWEPDYDYGNWEWYLGRTDGGDWDLLTWGY